jgi:diguanylate cyclase (GGDEF)-like protein
MRIKTTSATLKVRMTLLVAMLVLAASGMVAVAALYIVERQMTKVIGDQQFSILSGAAAYIDSDLSAKKALLRLLSEQLPPEVAHTPSAMQGFLEAHATLRDEFANIAVFDSSGALIANLNDRRAIGSFNVATRKYFRDTVNAHEGLISEPFKSKLSGKPVVLVTQPVFDPAGRLLYVLSGGIDLEKPRFFGQFEALKPGTSGYLFMLAADGAVIHHPDQRRLLRRVTEEAGGAVPSTLAALNGFEGWTRGLTKSKVEALITYKRLRTTSWIVGAVFPVDEALAALIEMRKGALFASAAVAALAGLLGWMVILRLLRPLEMLQRHVNDITAGSADISVFAVQREDEFGYLSRAFHTLSQQRAVAEANLLTLVRTDPLTGIGNRRLVDEVLGAAIARAARSGRMLALAYLDIDRFKAINDTHGHGVGDQVLIEFAQRLVAAVRSTDTVARLAGDEFVVIFENLASEAEASVLGQKILDAMRVPFMSANAALTITASVGIALDALGGMTPEVLLGRADEALYIAKSGGRNGYAVRRILAPLAGIGAGAAA